MRGGEGGEGDEGCRKREAGGRGGVACTYLYKCMR